MRKKKLITILFVVFCVPYLLWAAKEEEEEKYNVYDEITDTRYLDRYDMYVGIEYNMPYEGTAEEDYKRRNIQLLYGKKFMFEQTYIEISLGAEKKQKYEILIGSEDFTAINKGFQTKIKMLHFFNNTILHNFYYTGISYSVVYEQTEVPDYKEGFSEIKYANHLTLYFGYEIPFDYTGRKNGINFEVAFDVLPYVYGFSSNYVSETNRLIFTIGYKHYF